MAKIELSECWTSVAEPLRALMAELERAAHAERTTPANLAAVSARWAQEPGHGPHEAAGSQVEAHDR